MMTCRMLPLQLRVESQLRLNEKLILCQSTEVSWTNLIYITNMANIINMTYITNTTFMPNIKNELQITFFEALKEMCLKLFAWIFRQYVLKNWKHGIHRDNCESVCWTPFQSRVLVSVRAFKDQYHIQPSCHLLKTRTEKPFSN